MAFVVATKIWKFQKRALVLLACLCWQNMMQNTNATVPCSGDPGDDCGECVGNTLKDDEILCGNGEVRTDWTCGELRGYRAACPPNVPFLCAKKNDCGGGIDQCCESSCDNKGGNAECPAKLATTQAPTTKAQATAEDVYCKALNGAVGDCAGNDSGNHGVQYNLAACKERCRTTPGCKYYVYWKNNKMCYPKHTCTTLTNPDSNAQAYQLASCGGAAPGAAPVTTQCAPGYKKCRDNCCDVNHDCICDKICGGNDRRWPREASYRDDLGCSYDPSAGGGATATNQLGTSQGCVATGIHFKGGYVQDDMPLTEIPDALSCSEMCSIVDDCEFWVFYSVTKRCWLKTGWGEHIPQTGVTEAHYTSGKKGCGDGCGKRCATNLAVWSVILGVVGITLCACFCCCKEPCKHIRRKIGEICKGLLHCICKNICKLSICKKKPPPAPRRNKVLPVVPKHKTVTKSEARDAFLDAHVSMSDAEFEEYWEDCHEKGGIMSYDKLMKKIDRKKDEKLRHKQLVKAKGEAQFASQVQKAGVDGLTALTPEWSAEVVPKNRQDEDTQNCVSWLNGHMDSLKTTGSMNYTDDGITLDYTMGSVVKPYWNDCINMYKQCLRNSRALMQVRMLLFNLGELYVMNYDGIFKTEVQEGDRGGYEIYKEEVVRQQYNLGGVTVKQTTTDITRLYEHALAVQKDYDRLAKAVAERTGGEFTPAPLKHVWRAIEKCALRPEKRLRFKCNNVYDVVRGALVYDTMAEIARGLEEVCDTFDVVRIKDRFEPVGQAGKSGGWRDCVVNMRLKGDTNNHVLEVQLQLRRLLDVRTTLGGHYCYAKYRSLTEALEVCDKDTFL